MRRFILIAAMLLISASARADGPRGLSLASNNETVVLGQPSDAAPQPPKADQAQSDQAKPEHAKSASSNSDKRKVKRSPIEARVVDELHRHGIYW